MFKSVEMFIIVLLTILTVIISIFTLFIGTIPMLLLFATITSTLDSYESKQKNKNLNKLKEKCTKLKNKSEEKLKTTDDPKEKQTLKETIDGCNKVLSKIKELEEIDKNMNLNAGIKAVKELIKWYEDPNSFYYEDLYFSNVFYTAKVYKIPERVLINKIKTIKHAISLDDTAIGNEDKYKKLLGNIGIKDIEKDYIVIISHEDYYLLYDDSVGLFVLSYDSVYKVSSLYSEADNSSRTETVKDKFGKDKWIKITEKEIIAADKALGYFKLSKCPQQVIPNEFPIKY